MLPFWFLIHVFFSILHLPSQIVLSTKTKLTFCHRINYISIFIQKFHQSPFMGNMKLSPFRKFRQTFCAKFGQIWKWFQNVQEGLTRSSCYLQSYNCLIHWFFYLFKACTLAQNYFTSTRFKNLLVFDMNNTSCTSAVLLIILQSHKLMAAFPILDLYFNGLTSILICKHCSNDRLSQHFLSSEMLAY